MKFGSYEMETNPSCFPPFVAERYKLAFPNGYSVSVIRGMVSFDAWELAVLFGDDLTYDTPVTNDVERGDEERIAELIAQVEALPTPESLS